ncbi:MAG: MarR family winged helix-turn-helix transcriptional regulator [Betaproteobacteria bacterium]
MPSPPRLIFLVNSAARRLQQCIAARQLEAARALGAAPTAAQGGVLFVLDKGDGATMGELALALDLAPSAVSGLVQRMEALEWVVRRACPDDARTQRVWLLPAGRRALPALYEALARLNRQIKAGFTDAELQTVARWLRHVQQLDEPTP